MYALVIKLETAVREALDAEIVEALTGINESFHANVSEECILIQGQDGVDHATDSCHDVNDLSSFVMMQASFF